MLFDILLCIYVQNIIDGIIPNWPISTTTKAVIANPSYPMHSDCCKVRGGVDVFWYIIISPLYTYYHHSMILSTIPPQSLLWSHNSKLAIFIAMVIVVLYLLYPIIFHCCKFEDWCWYISQAIPHMFIFLSVICPIHNTTTTAFVTP